MAGGHIQSQLLHFTAFTIILLASRGLWPHKLAPGLWFFPLPPIKSFFQVLKMIIKKLSVSTPSRYISQWLTHLSCQVNSVAVVFCDECSADNRRHPESWGESSRTPPMTQCCGDTVDIDSCQAPQLTSHHKRWQPMELSWDNDNYTVDCIVPKAPKYTVLPQKHKASTIFQHWMLHLTFYWNIHSVWAKQITSAVLLAQCAT